MSATLDAAVHLGQDYLENFNSTKNQTQRTIRQLFDVSQNLIKDLTEIPEISKMSWHTPLAKDNFVDRQSSPVIDSKSLCILRISIVSWQNESTSRVHRRMEKKIEWFTRTLNIENWIESTGSQSDSSGKNFPEPLRCIFSPRSRK